MKSYPEMAYDDSFYRTHEPNDPFWSVAESPLLPATSLKGKRILFLGSSVTLGLRSHNEAVGDYLAKQDGILLVKEAISGTTLRQEKPDDLSYLSRLLRSDAYQKRLPLDAIIIQLSTNDAWDPKKLGTPLKNENPETTFGAIEALIRAVKSHWDCPLFFYTSAYYDLLNGPAYAVMVKGLKEIAEKRGTGIIDLFSDASFNELGQARHAYWMSDAIHPFRAGYRAWWTPFIRQYLLQYLCKSDVFSL
jgi:Lysophospholipase L1 and related esterases